MDDLVAELKDVRPMPWDDDIADVCERAADALTALQARIDALTAERDAARGALNLACTGLQTVARWCEEEEPLEYNDGMRKAFMRNASQVARAHSDEAIRSLKESRP